MAKFRVLALDGGGIRGLLTTRILARLCREPGLADVFESVDLIAGTSSGGLIALAMAHGLGGRSMAETIVGLQQLFEKGEDTFGPRRFLSGWFLRAKYESAARERAFRGVVGESKTLGQLNRKVLIPAFDLDNQSVRDGQPDSRKWKPKVFHNFEGEHSDSDQLVWKVALYTTALPVYFPSVDGYIDGGVFANNPSMCALAQILDTRYEPRVKPQLNEIVMLSIGAGLNLKYIAGNRRDWGFIRWGWWMVDMTVDASVGIADYQSQRLLGAANYHRIAPELMPEVYVGSDDVAKIDLLKRVTDDISLDGHAAWLREHWLDRAATPKPPRPRETTSKHILSTTEITCVAPIKEGFVGALDTRTYATRLRIVMRVLHGLRLAAREARSIKAVVDIVDAIRSIHSFQFAIVNERQLVLAVTFAGAWEPYMRIIWRDLGPLMDLVLCNCKDYADSSSDKGFERFSAYIRQVQAESDFFYPASGLSVDDHRYLELVERTIRDRGAGEAADEAIAGLAVQSPSIEIRDNIGKEPREAFHQALLLLQILHGLRSLYPDTDADSGFLARATLKLLEGSALMPRIEETLKAGKGLAAELAWFKALRDRASERAAGPPQRERGPKDEIQGGILRAYKRMIGDRVYPITHGCLLLARITDPVEARRFLRHWTEAHVTSERAQDHDHERDAPARVNHNIAFTCNGLRQLGLPEPLLAQMPREFKEGMELRAGLLGDIRGNHPEHWILPEWNVGIEAQGIDREVPRVRMSTIDIVVLLTTVEPHAGAEEWVEGSHPLYAAATAFERDARRAGIRVLSRQLMRNHLDGARFRDHFGFVDGISQPAFDGDRSDRLPLGELLAGYENERGDPAFATPTEAGADETMLAVRGSILDNATFLVVRKLEQHVERLPADRDALARMMGRTQDGAPLADPARRGGARGNDFTYAGDPKGARCPLHAHIRRANPRTNTADKGAARVPRILRRGMSYGPPVDAGSAGRLSTAAEGPIESGTNTGAPRAPERGLMFMAYNASIAEQFEVIQRWMTGGNSTGVFSGQRDPFVGVPDPDKPETFRFLDASAQGGVRRIELPRQPLVTLRWGLYLFVPSMAAMARLCAEPPDLSKEISAEQVRAGQNTIERLRTADDWATVYEDVSAIHGGITEVVSAAIRALDGGIRRTPYGVIVAGERLVMQVLENDRVFSVAEYRNRMDRSIGQIYLGLDAGEQYDALATAPNRAIQRVSAESAFAVAWKQTLAVLSRIVPSADPQAVFSLEQLADGTLAGLSRYYFDIPDDESVLSGGRPEPGDKGPRCPFHSLAPSRYIFSSPQPRQAVAALGATLGQQLRQGARRFVERHLDPASKRSLKGPLSRALFDSMGDDDPDALASNLVGLLEGFLPTVWGNFLKVTHLWITEETLWRLQQDLWSRPDADYQHARRVLERPLQIAMMRRPIPDLLYRTATQDVDVGGLRVRAGERVVVSVASATGELLRRGTVSVAPLFGGYRTAARHPTHACPGYEMAMGVLLGMLTALLQAGSLSPRPHPLLTLGDPRPLLARPTQGAAVPEPS